MANELDHAENILWYVACLRILGGAPNDDPRSKALLSIIRSLRKEGRVDLGRPERTGRLAGFAIAERTLWLQREDVIQCVDELYRQDSARKLFEHENIPADCEVGYGHLREAFTTRELRPREMLGEALPNMPERIPILGSVTFSVQKATRHRTGLIGISVERLTVDDTLADRTKGTPLAGAVEYLAEWMSTWPHRGEPHVVGFCRGGAQETRNSEGFQRHLLGEGAAPVSVLTGAQGAGKHHQVRLLVASCLTARYAHEQPAWIPLTVDGATFLSAARMASLLRAVRSSWRVRHGEAGVVLPDDLAGVLDQTHTQALIVLEECTRGELAGLHRLIDDARHARVRILATTVLTPAMTPAMTPDVDAWSVLPLDPQRVEVLSNAWTGGDAAGFLEELALHEEALQWYPGLLQPLVRTWKDEGTIARGRIRVYDRLVAQIAEANHGALQRSLPTSLADCGERLLSRIALKMSERDTPPDVENPIAETVVKLMGFVTALLWRREDVEEVVTATLRESFGVAPGAAVALAPAVVEGLTVRSGLWWSTEERVGWRCRAFARVLEMKERARELEPDTETARGTIRNWLGGDPFTSQASDLLEAFELTGRLTPECLARVWHEIDGIGKPVILECAARQIPLPEWMQQDLEAWTWQGVREAADASFWTELFSLAPGMYGMWKPLFRMRGEPWVKRGCHRLVEDRHGPTLGRARALELLIRREGPDWGRKALERHPTEPWLRLVGACALADGWGDLDPLAECVRDRGSEVWLREVGLALHSDCRKGYRATEAGVQISIIHETEAKLEGALTLLKELAQPRKDEELSARHLRVAVKIAHRLIRRKESSAHEEDRREAKELKEHVPMLELLVSALQERDSVLGMGLGSLKALQLIASQCEGIAPSRGEACCRAMEAHGVASVLGDLRAMAGKGITRLSIGLSLRENDEEFRTLAETMAGDVRLQAQHRWFAYRALKVAGGTKCRLAKIKDAEEETLLRELMAEDV